MEKSSSQTTGNRGTFLTEVLANERICEEHYRLILDVGGFPKTQAGQFVQLLCRKPDEHEQYRELTWKDGTPPSFTQSELVDSEPMLRRPLSLAGRREHRADAVELDIIYRKVGTGTRWLSGVKPGDSLSALGPLGNAFTICEDKPKAVLIGGGVGIPPMLYLAEALQQAGKDVVAFVGARSADLLPLRLLPSGKVDSDGMPSRCISEFAACEVNCSISTDNGTLGHPGIVSEPFTRWIDWMENASDDLAVYTCGPEPMMRAIAHICERRDIWCEVSLERYMACGMGTCQSCVVKIRDDSAEGWSYKLCCKDGPVFPAQNVIWD